MGGKVTVDPDELREEVKSKYREVALDPQGDFHFNTGRILAERLGYDMTLVNALPDVAVESFAGVANPFSIGELTPGLKVVDAGSGAGFDSFIASSQVAPGGQVIGIGMIDEMAEKSQSTAELMGRSDVVFRKGLIEAMPVEDGWAGGEQQARSFKVFGYTFSALKPG